LFCDLKALVGAEVLFVCTVAFPLTSRFFDSDSIFSTPFGISNGSFSFFGKAFSFNLNLGFGFLNPLSAIPKAMHLLEMVHYFCLFYLSPDDYFFRKVSASLHKEKSNARLASDCQRSEWDTVVVAAIDSGRGDCVWVSCAAHSQPSR